MKLKTIKDYLDESTSIYIKENDSFYEYSEYWLDKEIKSIKPKLSNYDYIDPYGNTYSTPYAILEIEVN